MNGTNPAQFRRAAKTSDPRAEALRLYMSGLNLSQWHRSYKPLLALSVGCSPVRRCGHPAPAAVQTCRTKGSWSFEKCTE
jgi:hypothetical protein